MFQQEPERIARVLEAAEELLAELQDTVFDARPPEFDTHLDAAVGVAAVDDTVIDTEMPHHLLDTLTTEPAALGSAPMPAYDPPTAALAPVPVPRPSGLRALLAAIKQWLGLGRRRQAQTREDDDGSNAWTYTVADRMVAQARAARRR
jgi:hypothetical protein